MRLGRSAGPFAALMVVGLLAVQGLPSIALSAQSQAPSSPSGQNSPTIAPDYLILGQLQGASVLQSDRPRSATVPGYYQFAATYYGPGDLQSAYGATSLFSQGDYGSGKTIAIIDAYGDPTIYQDLATFDKDFGLPSVSLTVIPVGPYEPSLGITFGWDAETALDVEAAHAMAPYAHINLVIGANASNALFEAVKLVVTHHLGDVVSMSWGLGENSFGESGFSAVGFLNYPYVEYWFQQGVAQGISFFASTGDYGAFQGTTTVTSGYPASSPFVTGVGGTTLYLAGSSSLYNSSSTYAGEEAWSISPQYVGAQGVSSSGGNSALFPKPYYQSGVGVGSRASPDVSADANPYTGMVIVLEGGLYAIGGTSLSSPMWAGMTAVLDQYVGRDLGLLNPYLYSVYANQTEYSRDFHQVTYGYNGEYSAGAGYNLVTGLGSPNLPSLAADIRAQARGLSMTVGTSAGPSPTAPVQYTLGTKFTIAAAVSTPQGTPVTTGTFTATVENPSGVVATVPLVYGVGGWTGSYRILPTDPTGSWTITVSGTSGGAQGYALAEVNVGDSIGILGPIPYPFGTPVSVGVPFIIQASAQTSAGTPIDNASLTAKLTYEGRVVQDVPLIPAGGGMYGASVTLVGAPQGTYSLVVGGAVVGSAFEYLYVGEALTGVMLTPTDTAIPSVTPGQQVTFLAKAETAAGAGAFTSNITAKIYALSGALMASVKLSPAPNKVQFGVFNFFRYQQANYTIPGNLTQGFYQLQFISSYQTDATSPVQSGNFTTGFYVSGPGLMYKISVPTTVYEGQTVEALAKVTDSSGNAITSGVFLATFIPSGYAYEAYATDFYGYTSVPMAYDAALGAWVAEYQVPSVLSSPNAFVGNLMSLSSGPWTVFIGGESRAASTVAQSNTYITVLPYTWYGLSLLDRTNVATAPLVSVNGTGYALAGVRADSLTIQGLDMTLTGVSIGNLTLVDSKVTLDGSQAGSVTVTNSTVSLTHGTKVGKVSPALPTISVAGLSQPLTGSSTFTVTVAGQQLTNGSLTGTVDGVPVPLATTSSSSGVTAKGTVDTASLSDGIHTLILTATQKDGLSTSVTTYFTVNTEGSALSTLTNLFYAATFVAILALIVAVLALRRKAAPSAPPPPPAPQV